MSAEEDAKSSYMEVVVEIRIISVPEENVGNVARNGVIYLIRS